MVKFSAQIRATIGADGCLDEVEQRYARCRDLMAPEARPADAPMTANIPVKAALAFQAGLRRVAKLTESFVTDVNDGGLGTASADALLQTAGMLIELQLRTENVVENKTATSVSDLDQQATDLLASTPPDSASSDGPQALHTPTVIAHTRQQEIKAIVSRVGFGLLLIITAIERYRVMSGLPARQ